MTHALLSLKQIHFIKCMGDPKAKDGNVLPSMRLSVIGYFIVNLSVKNFIFSWK